MTDVLSLIQSVAPDAGQQFLTRINILRHLSQLTKRVGRKSLASDLNTTERAMRVTLDEMRGLGLVDINYSGVKITPYGQSILNRCNEKILTDRPSRIYQLEHDLRASLGCQRCWVIEGDSDLDPSIYKKMSLQVQKVLADYLPEKGSVVAVTGGSTLARIADAFTPDLLGDKDITYVPTRGGVSGDVEIQSNAVVAKMAQKTNGHYLPLYIPENLDEETKEVLLKDHSVRKTVELSLEADCILLSVGTADEMAERRQVTKEQDRLIEDEKAVGEAFGTFFDEDGEAVIRSPRIGVELSDLEKMPMTLTVVGGSRKGNAVRAFFKIAPSKNNWLVCDEGVATMVLTGGTH